MLRNILQRRPATSERVVETASKSGVVAKISGARREVQESAADTLMAKPAGLSKALKAFGSRLRKFIPGSNAEIRPISVRKEKLNNPEIIAPDLFSAMHDIEQGLMRGERIELTISAYLPACTKQIAEGMVRLSKRYPDTFTLIDNAKMIERYVNFSKQGQAKVKKWEEEHKEKYLRSGEILTGVTPKQFYAMRDRAVALALKNDFELIAVNDEPVSHATNVSIPTRSSPRPPASGQTAPTKVYGQGQQRPSDSGLTDATRAHVQMEDHGYPLLSAELQGNDKVENGEDFEKVSDQDEVDTKVYDLAA